MIDFFDDFQTLSAMSRRWPRYTAKSLRATLRQLTEQTLLQRSDRKHPSEKEQVRALQRWRDWNPAAGFFHMSTKDAYSDKIETEEIEYFEGLRKAALCPAQSRATSALERSN